jgi:hypothetical protein
MTVPLELSPDVVPLDDEPVRLKSSRPVRLAQPGTIIAIERAVMESHPAVISCLAII